MYYVMDAHSFYNFIYFILLIIVSARSRAQGTLRTWGLEEGRVFGSPQGTLRAMPASWEIAGGAVFKRGQPASDGRGSSGQLLEASITFDCLHFSFLGI